METTTEQAGALRHALCLFERRQKAAERIAAFEAGQMIRRRAAGGTRHHVYLLLTKPQRVADGVFVAEARRICYYGRPGEYRKPSAELLLSPLGEPEVIS